MMGAHALQIEPGISFTDANSQFKCQYNKVVGVVSQAALMSRSELATGGFEAVTTAKKFVKFPEQKRKYQVMKIKKKLQYGPVLLIAASYDYVSLAHDDDAFLINVKCNNIRRYT